MTGGAPRLEVTRALAVLAFGCATPVLWAFHCVWFVLLAMDLLDPCGPLLPGMAEVAARAGGLAVAGASSAAILCLLRVATGSWRAGLVPVLAPVLVLVPDLLIDGGDCPGSEVPAWQEALSLAVAAALVVWALAVWIVGLARLASR